MAALRSIRRRFLPFLPKSTTYKRWRTRIAHQLGYVRTHTPWGLVDRDELNFDSLLGALVEAYRCPGRPFRFMQIGAYDGVVSDHLHQIVRNGSCHGVFVEPQTTAFARLRENYRDVPGLTFMNVAIDHVSGQRDFYTTNNENSVLASFDKSNLLKHGIADVDIVSKSVSCMTVTEVLAAVHLESVDLLQIDAEGHDWAIIESIDLESLRPSILRFEIAHLSRADRENCIAHLSRFGYRFLVEKMDIVALQPLVVEKRFAA